MGSVDLKVGGVVVATIGLFTLVANVIPQVQSEVPAVVAFGANVTAEELVEAGSGLYEGAGGCTACHAESAGARAPNLLTDYRGEGTIGARCGSRISGMSCKEYLYQAVVEPDVHLVDDYPPIMPSLARTMDGQQIWAIVAYLEGQGGEVTVTAADIEATMGSVADAGGGPAAAGGVPGGPEIATSEPSEIVQQLCVMCHILGDEGGPLGPPLDGVGSRLSAEGIRSAILDPQANVAEGYEELAGMMPPNFGDRLTATQLEAVVRYLSGLQ